jgi:YggT family protein
MFGFQLPIVNWIITYGISFIILAMFIRAVASLLRFDERYAIIRFLARITDPFIDPVRRIVPPMGIIDMAFIITFFLLRTMQVLLLQGLPANW